MSRHSQFTSLSIHALILALLLLSTVQRPLPPKAKEAVNVVYVPAPHLVGGGGMRSNGPVRKGFFPTRLARVFTPPMIQLVTYQPKLVLPTAIESPPDVQVTTAQLGDLHGLGLVSGGTGGPAGLGEGKEKHSDLEQEIMRA